MANLTKPKLECDRRILLIVVLLLALGASLVASASSYFAADRFNDAYFLLRKHIVRIVIAAIFLLVGMHVDYRVYRRLAPVAVIAGIVLLLGLFVSGHAIRNTYRWFYIEALKVTFQPSEIARVALVFFLAFWIARMGADIKDFRRGFLPAAVVVLLVVGLMAAQPNYGTATATMLIAMVLMFAGGVRFTHLAGMSVMLAGIAALRVARVDYVRERLFAFLDTSKGVETINWQVHQSLIAMGSGGVFGSGFGSSRQKFHWLPDSHTDFIFAILGEEAGMIGTMLVSALFLLLVLRALKLSMSSADRFGELLIIGVGTSVFVYAALNMAVATGLFPVTGLPLPFLSYGGSALVVNAFSVGVLLNVSRKRWHGARGRRRRVQGGSP